MPGIVQVKLRGSGKTFYLTAKEGILVPGDYCIVKFERGVDYGQVLPVRGSGAGGGRAEPEGEVVRKATDDDMIIIEENRLKEEEAFDVCLKKVAQHKLDMKLVGVEYTFDRAKMIFYFTASGRVDFRTLVKDLASIFKSRIELRQIGVRDEARIVGGIGSCGRELCCCTFLKDFEPINIKMAKEQGMPLNPSKISGLCGRLMCCLRYESACYRELSRNLPKEGSKVKTRRVSGRVVATDVLRQTVTVLTENNRRVELKAEDFRRPGRKRAP